MLLAWEKDDSVQQTEYILNSLVVEIVEGQCQDRDASSVPGIYILMKQKHKNVS